MTLLEPPPSEAGPVKGVCFRFVSLCVSLHSSPALGHCWLADCHRNQWARDRSLKSIPVGGFAHSMSKHTEALYLKPDGDTAPCSGSAQTKSHLCSHGRSQFSQQFLCIARSECHHKQIPWCRVWSWRTVPLFIKEDFANPTMNLGLFVFCLDTFAGCLCSHRHLCDAFIREGTDLWSSPKHTRNRISLLTRDQKLVLLCVDEINCACKKDLPQMRSV